jgi:tellurite resistance protein
MTAASTVPAASMRLAHYPVTFFAIGMGMIGATLAIRAAERAFSVSTTASTAALIMSVAMFAAITVGYAAKALLHSTELKAEWHHPVRIAVFPTISISLLLLAAALLEPLPHLAHAVWLIGNALQGVLALAVIIVAARPFLSGNPGWVLSRA